MRTKLDPDDEFFIPDVSGLDWSKAQVGRPDRLPGEKTEICIDAAVGYSLRLIPSNKILGRFTSTLEAWPVIISTVEGGRSPRTLSLDWIDADGTSGSIFAGPRLEGFARLNNGEPHPYPSRAPGDTGRRVAEGCAVPRHVEPMQTSDDDDLEIPETDFSIPPRPNRYARKPGEKTEICIDGAVGYSLRLIPSNKILARFKSTLEAWPAIIATVEGGRSPRTLSLDWKGADGTSGRISAGPRLERWARHNNGEAREYAIPKARPTGRRVADV